MKKSKTPVRYSRKRAIVLILFLFVLAMAFVCLFVGSSNMSVKDCVSSLLKKGSENNIRIVWNIRIPRVIAAVIAGAGLSVSGLIMQTNLNNPMLSSTLGVSNAAVFGANLSIIGFAGGFLTTGNNPLNFRGRKSLCHLADGVYICGAFHTFNTGTLQNQAFSPNVVVLAGIAIGAVWTAGTTILQFYATDVGISAAMIWNFGDLGRATYKTDLIMFAVITFSITVFSLLSWYYNVLLSGDGSAKSMGVPVDLLRFVSMLLASLMTAVCVSFLGIIGFVGIICPHVTKKLIGEDHRFSIPVSALSGSLLLLLADTLSRSMGGGSALPVGAITSFLGAPFFIAIIFSKKEYE